MDSFIAIKSSSLNRSGIEHLEASNYDGAIRDFSKGLGMVKQVLALHEDQDEMDCHATCPQHEECFYFAHRCLPQHSSGKGPFIFCSPIVVSEQSDELTSFQFYVHMSYVLLYNLALSHHLSGLGNGSLKRLQKAQSLYELAYTVQMTEELQLSVMQTMAIVNNLGHLHTILGSEEKSEQCFQHLLSTIMFVNDCGEQEAVQQMEGFIANVMPLILKQTASAPAA